MIVKLISKYLETHKRLVVPNLGAFIVKVPGQSVLFSNLIKNDDGVLRSLLTADGISDMEAAAAVDRFVFEVRFRLQNNGVCRLAGFGELRCGVNETVTFVYAPATEGDGGVDPDALNKADNRTGVAGGAAEAPAEAAAKPAAAGREAARHYTEPERRVAEPSPERLSRQRTASATVTPQTAEDVSERRPKPDAAQMPEPDAGYDPAAERRQRRDMHRDRMKALYDEPHISVSPKRHPADYVKGLRYGKGRKASSDRDMGSRSRRRNDRILIIAIVAAALAIAALGYGYYCDVRAARMDSEYYDAQQGDVVNPDLEYIEESNE